MNAVDAAVHNLTDGVDDLHPGSAYLIDGDATPENAREVRRLCREAGYRVRYTSGRTLHGSRVVALETVGTIR